MTERRRISLLADKWLMGTISEVERHEFMTWYVNHDDELLEVSSSFSINEEELRGRIFSKVIANTRQSENTRRNFFGRKWQLGIAASFLLATLSVLIVYKITQRNTEDPAAQPKNVKLKLSDGKVIYLRTGESGIVVDDQIAYIDGTPVAGLREHSAKDKRKLAGVSPVFELSTPKGVVFQVKLYDGTRVWLNAGSTLKYPLIFNRKIRQVELQGEAFFEVSKIRRECEANIPHNAATVAGCKSVPFEVKTAGQTVRVLGTKFNISAYQDAPVTQTTLTEGAVFVKTRAGRGVRLSPGEQSTLTQGSVKVKSVDVEAFTAWKDGYFYFKNTDLYTIMSQFASWYDVDVEYQIPPSGQLFTGKIPRSAGLNTALNILKAAGVSHKITEGNHVIVIPSK